MVCTRGTPQRRNAASRTSSLPVRAPVCDAARKYCETIFLPRGFSRKLGFVCKRWLTPHPFRPCLTSEFCTLVIATVTTTHACSLSPEINRTRRRIDWQSPISAFKTIPRKRRLDRCRFFSPTWYLPDVAPRIQGKRYWLGRGVGQSP